jgi:sugar phosphate isomerase/epimerase
MQLGIFAKTFAGTSPDVVLAQVKAAGFSVAQYNMACSGLSAMPDAIADDVIAEIRDASAKHSVTLNALSATYNMIHPDVRSREIGHRRLAVVAKAARDSGIPMITLCTGSRNAKDQWTHHLDNKSKKAWRDLIDSMTVAIGIAERFDVDLGIEPELANVVSDAATAKRLIDECKSPRIKIILDAANLFETEPLDDQRRIVSLAIDLLGPYIAMAHAKDRAADGSFVAAGTGVLDYSHFLRCLKDVGFGGPLVTHGLSAEEAPYVAAFLMRELEDVGVTFSPPLREGTGVGVSHT